MEVTKIEKQLIDNKREEYLIKFKDPMGDSVTLTLLPKFALITGGWNILIKLDDNINPYMRLAELVLNNPNVDYYDYFKTKIVENNRSEKYDQGRTKSNIQEYIKRCYQESIIEEYQVYKDLTGQEWKDFFDHEVIFHYDNPYFVLSEVFKYTKEKFIDQLDESQLSTLIYFSEPNYERYRSIFQLLQEFFKKTITKEAISEYYTKKEKSEV